MVAYRPIEERFAEKYKVAPNGCWEWHATKVTGGYGLICLPRGTGYILAHRLSYQIKFGEIPDKMLVCHKCDNPSCVNPDHLFVATHKENMKDMERKGRARILWPESVDEVISMLANGYSQTYVANHFGVSRSVIHRAINSPIGESRTEFVPVGKYTKLSAQQKVDIVSMLKKMESISQIAKAFNVDRKTIRNIRDKMD